MVNRAADAEAPDDTSHVKALEDAGARTFRGNARIVGKGPGRGGRPGRRRTARSRSRQRHRRDGFELEGAADRGSRRDAPVDEPPGDAHAGAAAQPARPRWRPDRRRARPGLRSVRRADDDRPVGPADPPNRHRPQRGGGHRGDPARRRDDPDRRAGAARAGRGRGRWGPRRRARRRIDRRGARDPAGGRARSRAGGPRPRALRARRRHDGTASRTTAGCAWRTGYGWPATRPARSCTPTRVTTRASSRSGWRSAKRSNPTTAPFPRATYTDPEAASVGVTLDQAREAGLDAFELVADFAKTAKGYSVEAEFGHVTIVVDRAPGELVGAAMAVPDASAAIHECVLAIKARVPVEILAETIHAFPSTSRIFNGLFADARRELERPGSVVKAASARRRPSRRSGPCPGGPWRGRRPARRARRGPRQAARPHRHAGRP